jgi:chemotaxis signal transduction protein
VSRSECLECIVLGTRMLVPTRDLQRVAEFPLTAPPPLAHAWVAGLGVVGGGPLVTLSLAGRPMGPLASCRALLLLTAQHSRRYAVLVDDVRAIWTIDPEAFVEEPATSWPCPRGWLSAASDAGGQVLMLDTLAVAGWLFQSKGAPTRSQEAVA